MSPTATTSQLQLAGPQDDRLLSKCLLTDSFKGNGGKNSSTCSRSMPTDSSQSSVGYARTLSLVPSHLDFLCSFSSEVTGSTQKDMKSGLNSLSFLSEDFQELTTSFPNTDEQCPGLDLSISPSSLALFKRERHSVSQKYSVITSDECETNLNSTPHTEHWSCRSFQQPCDTFDKVEELTRWPPSSSTNKSNPRSKNGAKRIKSHRPHEQFDEGSNAAKLVRQSGSSHLPFDYVAKHGMQEAHHRFLNPEVIMYQTQPFLLPNELVTQHFDTKQNNDTGDGEEENLVIDPAQISNSSLSLVLEEETDFLHNGNSVTETNSGPQMLSPQEPSESHRSCMNGKNSPLEKTDITNLQTRLETSRKADMLEEFFQLEESLAPVQVCENPVASSIQTIESVAVSEFNNDQATNEGKYLNTLEVANCQGKTLILPTTFTTTKDQIPIDKTIKDCLEDTFASNKSTNNAICIVDSELALAVPVSNEPSDTSGHSAFVQLRTGNRTDLNDQQTISVAIQCSTQLADAHTQTSPLQNCSCCIVTSLVEHLTDSVARLNP